MEEEASDASLDFAPPAAEGIDVHHHTWGLPDIGHLAVWSVSSAKQGCGVEVLRDNRKDTFWQSDGHVPHVITASFQRRVTVSAVQLYLDFQLDESYTPTKMAIKVSPNGTQGDMQLLSSLNVEEPRGWITVWLPDEETKEGMQLWKLAVEIQQNHQNGRDSHVRLISLLGAAGRPDGKSGGFEGAMLSLGNNASMIR